jgi:MFS transporter, FSR family, fosmidomycin resistance protein
MSTVVGVVCMRAWTYFGLITFLPLYFAFRMDTPGSAGWHLFVLLLSGAIGGLIGGYTSDRFGRKPVIAFSLLFCTPLLYLALTTSGLTEWAFTALAGATLLASFSPAILTAQDLIPRNQGIASGIVLGFAMGIGGMGIAITGIISDNYGIAAGMLSLVVLPFAGFLMAVMLPGKLMPQEATEK